MSGHILTVANNVAKVFVGADFIGKAQSKINSREVNVRAPLQTPLNTLIPASVARQISLRPMYDAPTQGLRLEVYKDTGGPIVR